MGGLGVFGREAHLAQRGGAGVNPGGIPLTRANERNRRRRTRRRHLDPALAPSVRGVDALLESELLEVELQCPVLVGDGTPTVRTWVMWVLVSVSDISTLRFVEAVRVLRT